MYHVGITNNIEPHLPLKKAQERKLTQKREQVIVRHMLMVWWIIKECNIIRGGTQNENRKQIVFHFPFMLVA